MYIVFPNGEIDDQDMEQLRELLDVLDKQFAWNVAKRKNARVPEQNVFWDRLSYIAGLGFVMCQQYINITYPTSRLNRNEALRLPPENTSGLSIVQIINAGANYWKHYIEDVDFPTGNMRNTTVEPIEALGISIESAYVCEGMLDRIVDTECNPFRQIIAFLFEWRENLIRSGNILPQRNR